MMPSTIRRPRRAPPPGRGREGSGRRGHLAESSVTLRQRPPSTESAAMKPSAPLALFSIGLAVAAPAVAQEASRGSIVTAGLTAGAMRFKGGLTEDVLTGVLQVQPHPWLTLGVAPTAARVAPSDSTAFSVFGVLSVSLGLSKQLAGAASPSIAAAFEVTLPTGSTTGGIGSRDPGWAADVGAGFAPHPGSYLFFNAGQSLTP